MDHFVTTATPVCGKRHANCYISKWNSTSDLFLITTAGEVDSIVFSVDIEIRPIATPLEHKVKDANLPQYILRILFVGWLIGWLGGW